MRRIILVIVTMSIGSLPIMPSPAAAIGFARISPTAFTWEGELTGARATSLAGADLGGETGPTAVLANPAVLGEGTGIRYAFSRGKDYVPWSGLDLESQAVSVDWNALRFSFARVGYGDDHVTIRTAYDVEIDITSFTQTMTVVGVSWEPARRWLADTPWRLAVGLANRHYRDDFFGRVASSDASDIGLAAGWRGTLAFGGLDLRGAWSKQNLENETLVGEAYRDEIALPQPWRAGLTARLHTDWPGRGGEMFALTLAYTHVEHTTDTAADSDRYGFEITVAELLSLRHGFARDSRDDPLAWGVGLDLSRPFMGPLRLRLHYADLDRDNDFLGPRELWGVEVGLGF